MLESAPERFQKERERRPTAHSAYVETPLTDRKIRLVEVFDGPPGSLISCRFQRYDLDQCPPYVALSYTWGPLLAINEISLNDDKFFVRDSLAQFLQRMRAMKRWRYVWIDALCIDQCSVREKSHQVGMMGDIYKKAETVIVWLGEQSYNSDVVMDLINNAFQMHKNPQGIPFEQLLAGQDMGPVEDLCNRPYWNRVWILQEVLMASDLVVLCGEKMCSWAAITSFFIMATNAPKPAEFRVDIFFSSAYTIIHSKAWWGPDGSPSKEIRQAFNAFPGPEDPPVRKRIAISTIVWEYRRLEATDRRDRIYAFLGVSDTIKILPDYSKTVKQLYVEVLDELVDNGHFDYIFPSLLSMLGVSPREVMRKTTEARKIALSKGATNRYKTDEAWEEFMAQGFLSS